jgi:GT2 family glycosyltransferase
MDQSGAEEVRNIVEELDDRLVVHCPLRQRGKSQAINTGMKRARGDLIGLLDDDVLTSKAWVLTATEMMGRETGLSAIVGRVLSFDEGRAPGAVNPQACEWPVRRTLRPAVLWKGFGANTVVRKTALYAVGGLDGRLGPGTSVPASEDWDLLYRLLMCGHEVEYVPDLLIWHDGWEEKALHERKVMAYDRARMAGHIKCWAEVGGPALRDMSALTMRLFFEGLGHLAHRRRGCAAANFRKLRCFMEGIPLGLRLACEGKAVYRDRRL